MTVNNPITKSARRHAFTLVEMLTVIVIIGILAGLVVGASIAARNAATRALIVVDMKQMEQALQTYKSEVGELPPDFANVDLPAGDPRGDAARARVVRHFRKAWPRMKLAGATTNAQFDDFVARLSPHGITLANLNPSTALTFWLGGLPNTDGKPSGFNEDPANPLKVGGSYKKPYLEFDPARLENYQYMQPRVKPPAPFVYFRAVRDNDTGNYEYGAHDGAGGPFTPFRFAVSANNICVPYLTEPEDLNPTDPALVRIWRSPETYQIIAAGLDGVFSTNTPAAPSDFRFSMFLENFTDGDYDNLASFAQGELEDES